MMSQFYQEQYTYGQGPTGNGGEVKTSAMSITALVLALIGIVPCCGVVTAPVGALLGLVALIRCSANPMLKGKGLAIVAMLLGVAFTVAQIAAGFWFYRNFVEDIVIGPRDAMRAASGGDYAGFKSHFVGAGATASDEEVKAFIEECERRYGAFVTSYIADNAQSPGAGSQQPRFTMPYNFTFVDGVQSGEATYEMVDQMTGQLVQKWSEIVIVDSTLGDLVYPPGGANLTETVEDAADEETSDEAADSTDDTSSP